MTGTSGIIVAVVAVGVPALVFTLWPLFRRGAGPPRFLALPPDPREQLAEQKRQILRALRELDFEHEAGLVSDDDHAELRARYESEAGRVLTELDRLGAPAAPPTPAPAAASARRSAWRHPAALAVGAVVLVVFGGALGAGIVRYTAPDPQAGQPITGSRPLAGMPPGEESPGGMPGPLRGPAASMTGPDGKIPPQILQGMLQAARQSLFAGQYGQAIAAYQAVLKRQPKNVDAMTHLGLIVAIGGHEDAALQTFDKALALDPKYPPALLYRGQVLFDAKKDVAGAVRSWEQFLAVAPPGEDRDRITQMVADAKAGRLKPPATSAPSVPTN